MFRGLVSEVRAGLEREAAHRRYVRLLEADDAALRELGLNRADVRLAFLLNQQPGGDRGGSGA